MKNKIRVDVSEVTRDLFVTVYIDGTWRVWIASKLLRLVCWILKANYEEE